MTVKKIVTSLLCCIIVSSVFLPIITVNVHAETTAEESRIMVSLGDSYSSGEGIEPFYGQNEPTADKVKNQDWLAHRSEKSWPGRLTLEEMCIRDRYWIVRRKFRSPDTHSPYFYK